MQLEIIIKLIYIDLSLYKLLITIGHYINSYKPTLMFSMLCNTPASPHPPPGASSRGSAGAGPDPRLRFALPAEPALLSSETPRGKLRASEKPGKRSGVFVNQEQPPKKRLQAAGSAEEGPGRSAPLELVPSLPGTSQP